MSKLSFIREIFIKSGGDEKNIEQQESTEMQIQGLIDASSQLMGGSLIVGQHNTMGVLKKAIPKIKYDGDKERVDPDKMKRIIDLSAEFSSDDMQEYVAGILAGEYNKPGSYSLQTMSIIRNLSKHEIETFRKFCSMIVNGEYLFGSFYRADNTNLPVLNEKGIGYAEYLYLQELGLFSGSDTVQKLYAPPENKIFSYTVRIGEKGFILKYSKEINLKNSLLTKAGKEICQLVEADYDEDLLMMVKEEFLRQGFEEMTVKDVISNS